jgi:hypothetical protein
VGAEENPVVTSCLNLLGLYGMDVWRNNTGKIPGRRFLGKKGRGDIIGVSRTGRFVNVECKRPGEEGRPDQVAFVEEVNRRGGIAAVVDSSAALCRYLEQRLPEVGEL